jgi:uncharacterized protein (TIGR01777 family)
MRVLVSGSSGLVGSALATFLTARGHQIVRLVRATSPRDDGAVSWDPEAGRIDAPRLEGLDAVVHLAGESIAAGRWTPARKARILGSRVRGTQLLAAALARLERPPAILACASAIGYYGDRGEEVLREDSAPGRGFLAEVTVAWEAAAEPARQRGLRVVHLRTGIVLSTQGGALAQMLPPFRMGVGGPLGSGRQWMSWITLEDLVQVFERVLTTPGLQGAVNAVSPHPVRNREFTSALGHVLSRPAFLPVPAFAVRLLFGEMGQELLLSSARVEPARLASVSHTFQHPDLEPALRQVLGRG